MDLRHDGRGDELTLGREGADVFETLEPIPELKRLRRALAIARTPPTQVDLRGTKPR
jgi:hypothetical protein